MASSSAGDLEEFPCRAHGPRMVRAPWAGEMLLVGKLKYHAEFTMGGKKFPATLLQQFTRRPPEATVFECLSLAASAVTLNPGEFAMVICTDAEPGYYGPQMLVTLPTCWGLDCSGNHMEMRQQPVLFRIQRMLVLNPPLGRH